MLHVDGNLKMKQFRAMDWAGIVLLTTGMTVVGKSKWFLT